MTAVDATEETRNGGNSVGPNGGAPDGEDQYEFFSLLSHVQRGRIDEQRCVFQPVKKTPCTPSSPESDMDQLFNLVANTQNCRLDDQRLSMSASLPGLHVVPASHLSAIVNVETGPKANHLGITGPRMEEQRCSAPHILLNCGTQAPSTKVHSRSSSASQNLQGPVSIKQTSNRSASVTPAPDKKKIQNSTNHMTQGKDPDAEDQDEFFSFLSHVQSGRMEEQRCVLDSNKKNPRSTSPADANMDHLLNLVPNYQSSHHGDPLVLMSASVPGLPMVSTNHLGGLVEMDTGQKANHLGSLHPRMEDQRCSAPHILLNPGSQATSTKAHSRPSSPSENLQGSVSFNQTPKKPASVTPASNKEKVQSSTNHSAQGSNLDGEEQNHFFSFLSHVQKGRMEEQCRVIDPHQKTACSSSPTESDIDHLFGLVTNTQCCRLDDQRASMSASLPGLHVVSVSHLDGLVKMETGQKTSQLVVGGPRIEEQQYSAPHYLLSPGSHSPSMNSNSRSSSPNQNLQGSVSFNQTPKRSESVTPALDKEKVLNITNHSAQRADLDTEDQDEFFSFLSHVQRDHMEEQRCVIDPDKNTQSTNTPTDSEIDQFFSLVANTQRSRLDDQRASMSTSLPGLHVVSSSCLVGQVKVETGQKPNKLGTEGPRLEEQRCSAPHILLNSESKAFSAKVHSRPASTNRDNHGSVSFSQTPKRSASATPAPDGEKIQNNSNTPDQRADLDGEDQDEFFSFLSHVQRGRMEQQRCVLDPNKKIPRSSCPTDSDVDQLLNLVTNSHSSRLDDQRVLMSASMPGLHVVSTNHMGELVEIKTREKANHLGIVCPRMEEQQCSAPRVLLSPGSPAPSVKVKSRSSSPSQNLQSPASFNQNPRKPPSFSFGTDKEAIQNSTYLSIQGTELDAEDQDEFFSFLSHVQSGRMEEQRCVLDHNKKNPRSSSATDSDMDQLLNLVANTQSCRLDDQRVSMNASLPGLHVLSDSHVDGAEKKDTSQKANQVGSLGDGMEDQQGSATQVLLKPKSKPESLDPTTTTNSRPASPSQDLPRPVSHSQTPKKSASVTPALNLNSTDHPAPGEDSHSGCPDDFLTLLSHVQWGRLLEEDCMSDPDKKTPCSPKETTVTYIDVNQLFRILATTPKDLLHDQFVLLNSLPGLRVISAHNTDDQRKLTDAPELGQIFNKFSGVQSPRREEQQWSLPSKPQTLEVPETLKPGPLGLSLAKAAMPGNRCVSPPNGPISPDDDYFSLIHRIHSSRLQNQGKLEGKREGGRAESSGARRRTEGEKDKAYRERAGRSPARSREESEGERRGGRGTEKNEGTVSEGRNRDEADVGKKEHKKEKGGKGKDKGKGEKKKGGKKEGKEKRKRGGRKSQKDS